MQKIVQILIKMDVSMAIDLIYPSKSKQLRYEWEHNLS